MCNELLIPPLLEHVADPVSFFQVFAAQYRQRVGPTGLPVQSGTIADAIGLVGHRMARLGSSDLRQTAQGKLDFRLPRQLRSYARKDPPPHQVKPIPIVILRHMAYR